MNILLSLLIPVLLVLLGSIQLPRPATSSDVPSQSVAFYRQHPLDAELVSRLCVLRDKQNQSALTDSGYVDWHRSEDWRRCTNPLSVTKAHELRKQR
ncbi:MAG: hypothetical protein JO002_01590 [Burkholderiaceae bacterium]|nr:hypothetical protein [Burkholderiaceae bacterium]